MQELDELVRNAPRDRGPGASLVPAAPIEVRLPGDYTPPAGAMPIDRTGSNTPLILAPLDLITIAVPLGWRARLAGIGFYAEDPQALASLLYTVRLDSADGSNTVADLVGQPAAFARFSEPQAIVAIAGGPNQLTISVTSMTGEYNLVNRFFVACRVTGWMYAPGRV